MIIIKYEILIILFDFSILIYYKWWNYYTVKNNEKNRWYWIEVRSVIRKDKTFKLNFS